MNQFPNPILVQMLDRLFAGLISGPNLNCRPHSSRQRVDWSTFSRLQDRPACEALKELFGSSHATQLTAKVAMPKSLIKKFEPTRGAAAVASTTAASTTAEAKPPEEKLSPEEQRQRDAWSAQQTLLTKLRGLAEDARDYEQDTGVHALHVGFPLLSLPPGTGSALKGKGGGSKRLLAPIAYIPVSVAVKAGPQPELCLEALYTGAEFLVPNEALFAWLERQTGKKLLPERDLQLSDVAEGANGEPNAATAATAHDPWTEINDLVRRISEILQLPPPQFSAESLTELSPAPRSDDEQPQAMIVATAVLGLFPMNNQGLLRDMQAMVAGESLEGPIQSFLQADLPLLEAEPEADPDERLEPAPTELLETDAETLDGSGASEAVSQTVAESLRDSAPSCGATRPQDLTQPQPDSPINASGPESADVSSSAEAVEPSGQARGREISHEIPVTHEPISATAVTKPRAKAVNTERLVSVSDPCQAHAVRMARECRGLVIHGPPGTGKSQTITNIIGDHLARGERVLLVCDKRTALDVVARRLEHIGLGDLCALIHDPQHDQRFLYKQVREQLDVLTETKVSERREKQLGKIDANLQKIYDELTEAWQLVMSPDDERGASFHERMGEWLEAALPFLGTTDGDPSSDSAALQNEPEPKKRTRRRRSEAATGTAAVEPATAKMLDLHDSDLRDLLQRASDCDFSQSAWRGCVGLSLSEFLSKPMSSLRDALANIVDAAADADEATDDAIPPFLIPAASGKSLVEQAVVRQEFAERLDRCLDDVPADWCQRWAKASATTIDSAFQQMAAVRKTAEIMHDTSVRESRLPADQTPQSMHELDLQLLELSSYYRLKNPLVRWLSFRKRARANALAKRYGLPPGFASIKRLLGHLLGLRARTGIALTLNELAGKKGAVWDPFDEEFLIRDWSRLVLVVGLLRDCRQQPVLAGFVESVKQLLTGKSNPLIDGLRNSTERAETATDLLADLTSSGLFKRDWLQRVEERLCRGDLLSIDVEQLATQLDSLQEVLRIQAGLSALPEPLRVVVTGSIDQAQSAEIALQAVRYRVLTDEITQWLQSNRKLQALDGDRRANLFQEVWRLEAEKRGLVSAVIRDYWVGRQRERLLASTGSRLSSPGADLKRRLMMRGERALRLRQVISIGSQIEGGDPLFDLRPVWMASPETVAQIFPRSAVFDVVIFDEASQCRLEEALPVLTRAKRVVIAGDPQQLPPSRFFESATISSDRTEIESEQQLFEAQQSGVEDLLGAALMLEMQQSYLDVHYRSRNSDLIEFSNEQFYGSRLQAIPGHPRNRIRFAPITVHRADGILHERANVIEAERVCQIVADLLKRSEPPSIGIACFNVTQRDLILDKLDELAGTDSEFRQRLGSARTRTGKGAFEGLFVKNLENVQGDERDHIIISTTYGPDQKGRFYRRFGPLGQVGGGRRLNVLVTRARDEVHLVTSIPVEAYRNLPPVPAGQQPSGGWLLFKYLAYAETLAEVYGDWREQSAAESDREEESEDVEVVVRVQERPSRVPSRFSSAFAKLMALKQHLGSDVQWGNDGFSIDVAFHHPQRSEDRTLGLLIDGSRFTGATDPVDWDLFRTSILASQGWALQHVATPQLFRDLDGHMRKFAANANEVANTEPDPDSIPVR